MTKNLDAFPSLEDAGITIWNPDLIEFARDIQLTRDDLHSIIATADQIEAEDGAEEDREAITAAVRLLRKHGWRL